jgi:hypothetical protein
MSDFLFLMQILGLSRPPFVVDDVDEMTAELAYHARTEDVFRARSMEHGARENFGIFLKDCIIVNHY